MKVRANQHQKFEKRHQILQRVEETSSAQSGQTQVLVLILAIKLLRGCQGESQTSVKTDDN
jgi:hypothetical protein